MKPTQDTKLCCAIIYGNWHSHSCPKKAKVFKDGKGYCGIHDPFRIEQKRKERDEKWKKKWDISVAKHERINLEREYCEGLTDDELKKGRKVD